MRMISLFIAVLLLSGCSGISVSVDYDRKQDFGAFRQYAWLAPLPSSAPAQVFNSELFGHRVQRAMDEGLMLRGLTRVEDEAAAEMLVIYHLGVEQRVDVQAFDSFLGYRACTHCSGMSLGIGTNIVVNDYQESTLAIDLINAEEQRLIWRAVVARPIRSYRDPAEYDRFVRETVRAILDKLPAGLGSATALPALP